MGTLIDFSEPLLRTFLPVLLQDHTTGKNIIWATDPPPELGVGFADEITLDAYNKRKRQEWMQVPGIHGKQAIQL